MNKQIGIVGVGNMGGGMAARLLDLGWQVRACDLVAERVDALVAQGATRAASPGECASGAAPCGQRPPGPPCIAALWAGRRRAHRDIPH